MLTRRTSLIAAATLLTVGPSCSAQAQPHITIYKDAACGCCGAWVDHLKASGFKTEVVNASDLEAIKAKYHVPADLASCHTGVINGYVIEGHVPAADVVKLLEQQPTATGIAVGGMPVNSPGMEVAGEPDEPYTVWLYQKDGSRKAFAHHGAS